MPRTCLSDLKIRTLESKTQTDWWDTKTPAFGIRVSPRSKTFIANRNGTRKTIGHYPAMSLQEARRRFFALKATTRTRAALKSHSSRPAASFWRKIDGKPDREKK